MPPNNDQLPSPPTPQPAAQPPYSNQPTPQKPVPPSVPGGQYAAPAAMPAFMNPNPNPVIHSGGMPPAFAAAPPKKSKKKLAIPVVVVGVALILAGGAAAAYNGLIGPTNPDKLWASAMTNSAKGYDMLVDYSKEHQNDKGGELSGTFQVDSGVSTDGSFEAKWFDGNGIGKADIGLGTTRATAEFRTIKSASTYPDIYLKAGGIKGLGNQIGSPEAEEIIAKVNDQWIVIDHTLLDNIQNQYGGTQSATDELSQEDLNQIAQKAGEAIKDHLFTSDTTKSVFVVKEKIGKEDRDGRGTYHYKAQVDKQHLKDFAAELKDKLNETKLKEVLGQRSLEETMDYDQLLKEIDGIDESKTVADVWVDRQAKLFSAIRFSEEGKPDNFVEFGTPYTGGDEVPFVVKASVKEDDSNLSGDFRVTLNTKTNTSKLTLDASGKSQTSTTKVKATMTAKTNNTPVDVQKPTGAKTISELFGIEPDELIPTLAPTIPAIEG